MKALVIGAGAREHALTAALSADPGVTSVHAAPGNPGIAAEAETHPVDVSSPVAVADLAVALSADLVVIGPEAPLVAGAADAVRDRGLVCFGPSAAAARLEGSKAFAKQVMAAAGVPTADSAVCVGKEEAAAALDRFGPPYVVKDDGLAAGKGVVVTDDREDALTHAAACERAVVEEYLSGPEVSLFAVCDGETALPLAAAQDFKRLGDDDRGPNTGGMGAYSPLPWVPATLTDDVFESVVAPTLAEMRRRGTPFTGLLYVGLALTPGGPRVVEFNARFGDPETQVVLPRLRTPLGGLLHAGAIGGLAGAGPLEWSPDAAVTVVLAAPGYPGAPRTGGELLGVAAAAAVPGARVLHAGTTQGDDGSLRSAGGRVLSVVGRGADLAAARATAYDAIGRITLDGGQFRADIASHAAGDAPVAP
jgi:phosphoribosylamine--glycine ligase